MWLKCTVMLALLALTQSDSCPNDCHCKHSSRGGVQVTCSSLSRDQQFKSVVATLELVNFDNRSGWTLENNFFTSVGLKDVSRINIVNASLEAIEPDAFKDVMYLTTVNISNNHLSNIDPNLFMSQKNLNHLSLRNNPLKLGQTFPLLNQSTVIELDLVGCNLTDLPRTTFNMFPDLEALWLDYNQIKNIDSATFETLIFLEELHLSNNEIQELNNDTFANNAELTILFLDNNPLQSIADVKITNLIQLDLSYCHFSKVDKNTFTGFRNLHDLKLRGNIITSVEPNSFTNLKKLAYLDLSNNMLRGPLDSRLFINNRDLETVKFADNPNMGALPTVGFEGKFSTLYFVDLSNCGLKHFKVEHFGNLVYVNRLNLSRNSLAELKPGVINSKVVVLDLSHNRLSQLNKINFPIDSNLHQLFLASNPLKQLDIEFFSKFKFLRSLDVSSCSLTKLWGNKHIGKSDNVTIQDFNLSGNKIQELSVQELETLVKLQTLDLSDNPLNCNSGMTFTMKRLTEMNVALAQSNPLHDTVSSNVPNRLAEEVVDDPDNVNHDKLGWEAMMDSICKDIEVDGEELDDANVDKEFKIEEHLDHNVDRNKGLLVGQDKDKPSVIEKSEGINSDDGMILFGSKSLDEDSTYDQEENSVRVQHVKNHQRYKYVWPIIIVGMTGLCLIGLLSVVVVVLLRWSRHRACYRHPVIKKAMSTSRLKKEGSSYEQLYDDTTSPTTPVMEQRNDSKPSQTYFSSSFHHSSITPESV